MVLTLAPFSGVNVTSKIALWETRAKTQELPAPMRAAKRLETSRIASSENESLSRSEAASPSGSKVASPSISENASPSSSCSLPSLSPPSPGLPPPSPAIGEICRARIWYYVAETQEASPVVELASVSLVTKTKTSAELMSPSLELPFESSTGPLITKSKTATECTSSSPGLPFESSCLLSFSESSTVPFEGTTSLSSPLFAPSSLSSESDAPMDELAALDLEGIKHVLNFPVAAPLSDLLWRK